MKNRITYQEILNSIQIIDSFEKYILKLEFPNFKDYKNNAAEIFNFLYFWSSLILSCNLLAIFLYYTGIWNVFMFLGSTTFLLLIGSFFYVMFTDSGSELFRKYILKEPQD